jgi:hypothetical protein
MEVGTLLKAKSWKSIEFADYKRIFGCNFGIIIEKELKNYNYGDIIYYKVFWLNKNKIGTIFDDDIKGKWVKVI